VECLGIREKFWFAVLLLFETEMFVSVCDWKFVADAAMLTVALFPA
jgi:hypothetical protein